jgi:hypothetical protein
MRSLNVLIGMESSGVIRSAFRRLGHNAVSCDFLASELPGPHLQCDVFDVAFDRRWDLGIFHPDCTNMCNSSSKHLYIGKKKINGRYEPRWRKLERDAKQFRRLDQEIPYPHAIENPIMLPYAKEIIGRGQDQLFQLYHFGHKEMKGNCLWLTKLPKLVFTTPDWKPPKDPEERKKWATIHRASPGPDRWKDRSRTRQGPADAMAMQWGGWATGIEASLIRADQAIIDLMEVTS